MIPRAYILIILFFAVRVAGAVEPLESIARVRALSPEEAARGLPVSVDVTVTFYDRPHPSLLAYDGREGIFVAVPIGTATPPDLATGSRVHIEGVTQPGGFLPILGARSITVLGQGPLPAPKRISGGELFSPSLDCQWVELPAIITGVEDDQDPVLVAEISGWTVKILVPHGENVVERATALLQRPVTIQGVVGSVFNEHRQLTARHLFVPSFAEIVLTEPTSPDDELALKKIDELLRSDATFRSRVRIQGTVTYAAEDGLYLRGDGGSILVRGANTAAFVPGTRVEAEGFGAMAPFHPILRATRITALARGEPPQPGPLDLTKAGIVDEQGELVRVNATFLTRREGPANEAVLQCRVSKWFFEAVLADAAGLPAGLAPNDQLRLIGICELTTTHSLPFTSSVDGFRLHLRDSADITIVRHAPWWTLRRLLWAVGGIGALALAAIVWASLLRLRVAAQTELIAVQIERAAVKDERQRIARELHDTIEQELAGLSVQLRNARQRLAHTPEQAATAIDLAERMLRHCRNEARTSIRDLRSVALEQRGLPGALDELLGPMAAECGAQFSLAVEGAPRTLAGPVEIHLLRIAQQAVANAAQHAAPRMIRARLAYAEDTVTIEIQDDGCGFDPEAPAPRGHFGVLGIRERANKLHAVLTIESAPGTGTKIKVVIPGHIAATGNGSVL